MSESDSYKLSCSCGWTHDATSRKSATTWKAWHRRQYQRAGQRLSEGGHAVVVKKVEAPKG